MDSYMAYYSIKPYKFIKPTAYDWNTSPSVTYPDTDFRQLTDGITGDPKSIYDPAWIGFQNGKATVQMKLNSERNIRWVGFNMLHSNAYGIDFADNYKLYCTIDNINWTLLGEYTLPVSKVDGEYTFANDVPLNANCRGLKAELSTSNQWRWIFLSEVEIVTNQ